MENESSGYPSSPSRHRFTTPLVNEARFASIETPKTGQPPRNPATQEPKDITVEACCQGRSVAVTDMPCNWVPRVPCKASEGGLNWSTSPGHPRDSVTTTATTIIAAAWKDCNYSRETTLLQQRQPNTNTLQQQRHQQTAEAATTSLLQQRQPITNTLQQQRRQTLTRCDSSITNKLQRQRQRCCCSNSNQTPIRCNSNDTKH